jgi:hypothetical protein
VAEAAAVHHLALEAVRVAERAGGAIDVAGEQRGPDGAAADRLVVPVHGPVHLDELDAVGDQLRPQLGVPRIVPGLG